MNAVANAVRPLEVTVRGRVEASRVHNKVRYTVIVTPAADAYSHPQIVEVRSKGQLGQKGDEVTQICRLGGFKRKPFKSTDKETGEIVTVVPVDHTLDALEV